ncbi:CYTH domain-containing protein [Antarcticibacterium sp. 1MA-6-2]|uniref:CYTH domain-containing protein n=1 Tax=Antarcticibacterium sp. 1MA-6-2 TaxID=2908210 RepID=UPI001F3DC44D|nr:CYTH domain-containing protein [Antarcticibacterium sp. 1MA-6-2]UJH90026.1 CYTH domain-containing protein [Antarcticibacterium sp. 1MA-6-2]
MVEIERKFLIRSEDYKQQAFKKEKISQGYLSSNPERTVRVRLRGDNAYLTVKGKSSKSGLSRFEWEKEISVEEAENLLLLCEPGKIEKTRYLIKAGEFTYEVDEFTGDNSGLTIAEIELGTEDSAFEKPAWLGEEVTGDIRYYNSQLCLDPYCNWKNL